MGGLQGHSSVKPRPHHAPVTPLPPRAAMRGYRGGLVLSHAPLPRPCKPRPSPPIPGGRPGAASRAMAANRVGRRQGRGAAPGPGGLSPGRGSPGGLSPGRGASPGGLSPGRGASPGRSPGVQRRSARVTVKYNRQELQRRLDTEQWIDGRLGELYRGR
ncbi:translation initiation factor IF-2-like, partial [Pyrgilauda ruficollis]|uniref:translation initiation factor IF-2-like n=1 Tax=Pyrgilauda ruficollis TaxID=221976 RepID=UPI001B8844AB